ncbi:MULTISPECIES: NAD(P)/FAD-dependent oxidoreductase [unclassified Caballeronia]|uniref:NAD(P)/FAD-dependent oxidoreductase n=1 Tax=unclassified Caballeronia TaxID=2646786 RepID=UPI00285DE35D|nr:MULTISPECIES: NAD(P)/FAD-dependent oxidoreductase [unclassified Caballeronia]MDR5777567.1 NAD(P)/FAD-dependent oxidoreductase [Caballeronia sp. LZ002]MDR5852990.1 NAD(P)/FAD-dependent oxidoreductase [Caballeronia sp. LZ003]
MKKPVRILIVGGGIGGLLLATKLGRRFRQSADASVTLVDSSATHIWKPMLHTIAAGTRDVHQQQVSYVAHAKDHGYAYYPGAMCGLDRRKKRIILEELRTPDGELVLSSRTLDYDVLVLALGSRANDFGTPGAQAHCHFIDTQKQAERFNEILRARLFRSVARNETFRVAIVGGGATGVELAAELSRLLEVASGYGDPTIRKRLELTLIESGARVLSSFPSKISVSSEELLKKMGFRVLTSTRVSGVEKRGFCYGDGERVPADLMVWAAGVKAPDFLHEISGLETTRSNQLVVRPTLQTTRDDHIFALGDCSSLKSRDADRPLAPTAQVATQQAEYLARALPTWLVGKPVSEFSYHNLGALVSLANYDAFGTLGQFGFFKGGFIHGRLAQLSHAELYRRHQRAVHGVGKAALLWGAEQLNRLAQPKIRLA